MSRERRTPGERRAPNIILQASHSAGSLTDDTDSQDDYEHSDSGADDADGWPADHRGEIDPSESASATAEYTLNQSRTARLPSRQHSVQRPHQTARYSHPAAVPTPPVGSHAEYMPGMSESDFYPGGAYHAPPPGARYPYDARYPQSSVGPPFAPPSHHAPPYGPMVPWAGQAANPFQPHSNYFEGHRHEMMPYQPPGYPVPYSSPGAVVPPNYAHHINHLVYSPAPGPPPTEIAPRGPTPAPPEEKKPDPEFVKMKEQLEMMQMERKKVEEAQARAELEQRIRQEEERRIKDRLEAMREAQEDAKKDIERARVAAEAAAMERLEEARKAEDERRRMETELRAQAAREERDRIEAERKAEAQRAKEQADALEKAERDAKEKYEAAKRAEEASKAEMARQKELIEIETKNKLLAEQRAAEEAKAAAELKAAEVAKQLEIDRETLRQKAIQDHEAKLAAEKKALAEAEQAAKAAKQQAHDEFVLKQAEDKKKAEEDAAAAEQAKKDAEELKAKILEEGKKAAAEEAKKASAADKEPIKFKDAVGRKYSFPWKLAAQWSSMEGLINQAFIHIPDLGPHIREGHYDLEGPGGELILKDIWGSTVQPGWSITMKMWPLDQHPLKNARGGNLPAHLREAYLREQHIRMQQQQQRAARAHAMPGQGGPANGPFNGMRPPPQHAYGAAFAAAPGGGRPQPAVLPDGIEVLPRPKKKPREQKKAFGWAGLFGGKAPAKKSPKNRKK